MVIKWFITIYIAYKISVKSVTPCLFLRNYRNYRSLSEHIVTVAGSNKSVILVATKTISALQIMKRLFSRAQSS